MIKYRLLKLWRAIFRRLFYPFASRMILGFLWLILWTCRVTVEGAENLTQSGSNRRILMLWHSQMALILYTLFYNANKLIYTLVISKSQEADIIACAVDRYKDNARTIRVAHKSRHQAIRQMITSLENEEIIMITPDGPRGPRQKAKRGIAYTAKETGADVIPFSWSCSQFWQLSTWDKFIIPKPFSKVHVSIGEPIRAEEHKDKDLGASAEIIQDRLNSLLRSCKEKITSNESLWPE
jgi:lysophospholipid acyltransferase (LPLAT)-like uncharacterized protein